MLTRTVAHPAGRYLLHAVAGLSLLATVAGGALAPLPAAADPFANAAFQRLWERTDKPVAQGKVARSWLWGNEPFVAKQEPYAQGPNGRHLVQYFDKSRMEINDPNADPNSPWYVTNGLLVVEMMTGKIQIGNNEYQQVDPSPVAVAGDTNDVTQPAPSYAALGRATNVWYGGGPDKRLAPGTPIAATIDKNGTTAPTGGPATLAKAAAFAPETQHNIPDVFWSFLNSNGIIYANNQYQNGPLMNWVFVMGYPVTEAFWTTIRVGGIDRQVLVQAFQRRVLTYSPNNPAGWQVEMGNVGRHYYSWRYERPSCPTVPVRGFGKVWANNPTLASAIGCPVPWRGEQAVQTAVERFEHGTMLYVAQKNTYPFGDPSIFVLFDDGTYQHFNDTYVEGQPLACNPSPVPRGFVVPQRGFNKVWCEGTGARVRERLGWALEPEKGGAGAWQDFQHGIMYWTGATNQIFAVLDVYDYENNPQHRWLGFTDTFNP
jgi:hypothetical protein